jgi:hypothetical protein
VDAEAIHTFRIEQAVSGAGPKTDLQRIWGSNHLVPAEGAETDGQHVWGSNHLVRGEG